MFSRDNIKFVLVAVFCLVVGLAGPSAAVIVKKALNSDKVDGLHAVKAGASVSKRKGKLVATNKQGFLPNNIIKQAPSAANAAKLGGQVPAAYRGISIPWSAMYGVNTGGTFQNMGLYMPDGTSSAADFSFSLPDTYTAGTPVLIDLTYSPSASQTCVFFLSATVTRVSPSAGAFQNLVARFPGTTDSSTALPAANPGRTRLTLTPSPGQTLVAGDTVSVVLARAGGIPQDTCTTGFVIYGAQVRF